jgi:4a-hydroxytetrahydrobiopterin dehydratase
LAGLLHLTLWYLKSFLSKTKKEYTFIFNMWIEENNELKKSFKFSNYLEALAFVNSISSDIEKLGHHPIITLTWGRVDIATQTHDAGNTVTDKDYQLTTLINTHYEQS